MASNKFSTQFPGVRYRVHKSRKYNGGNLDRYFFIRYRVNGKLKEEGIGWASALLYMCRAPGMPPFQAPRGYKNHY